MKRPAGFDERARVAAQAPPAKKDRVKSDRAKTDRAGRVPAGDDGASSSTDTSDSSTAEETRYGAQRAAAVRIARDLRDSVLPGKPEAPDPDDLRDLARRRWSPSRPRLEPQDRAARAELRRAARRRRRFEKKEVRRFTRRSRRRRITLAVVAGIAVTMVALVAVAVYSPLLSLRTITVDGTARIAAADVEAAVDGQLGTPLALLDNDRITDELGDFPLIRSFITETVPPDTLVIHVIERQPIGSLPTPSGFALVDPAGIVIERSASRIPGVPLIDIGGADADSAAFDAAVEVLVSLPDSVLVGLDTITATTKDDVRLAIASTGATIVWGSADDSEYKARVLGALLANVPGASEFNVSAPGQGTYKP